MSDLYRLESLTFCNFKLFGDEFTVNFRGNDLVVLDGPNGHGKTSIYDATELALTGDIRRLTSTENQQNPADVVVAHDNNRNCFVRIELRNKDDSIMVERRLKNNIPNAAKKISNFKNLWDLFLVNSNDRSLINQTDLNELIQSPNIGRDFTLFHYVEQEDTAHFLKHKSEKERASALSVLFGDTVEMQEKVLKVERVEKRLDEFIREKNQAKAILEDRGNLKASEGFQEAEVRFISLLDWKESPLEWDKRDIEAFSIEKRDSFLLELNKISALVRNREYFLNHRVHSRATSQREVLVNFLAYSQYINKLEKFKEDARQVRLVSDISDLLKGEWDSLLKSPFLLESFTLVGYEHGDDFLKALREIVDGKSSNQESSKIVHELLGYRSHLQAHLNNQVDEKECLLCGSNFDSHDQMIDSINNKEVALKLVLSSDEKRLDGLIAEFSNSTIPVFSNKVMQFLENKTVPTPSHISSLEAAKLFEERVESLRLWLENKKIVYSDLLLSYKEEGSTSDEIERSLLVLRKRIMEKVDGRPKGYNDLDLEVNFENIFNLYFNAKGKFLNDVKITDIDDKQKYIQQLFFQSISSDIKTYDALISELSKLKAKKAAIYELRTNLKKSISRYQKLLIKDIEIPFYIYSGKVLQAHQSGIGNGIFIKDKTGGDELKNIRFVSNWNSDHDVINTMSSGQIAAVVITLYLALNKVYAKGLGTLMIDDPVQTMDEINMISLVELLRNEFSDKQIILSTHEDHVSKYFLYKFLKYRRSVRQIKLMERKEFQLSN